MGASLVEIIVVSGFPGTGKSELAESLAQRLSVPYFSKDQIEAAIVLSEFEFPSKKDDRPCLSGVGYNVMTVLAENQLRLSHSAILDSICPNQTLRHRWRCMAEQFGATWCPIECICTDTQLHRRRLEARHRNIAGWYEIGWSDVQHIKDIYEQWTEDRLILDAVRPIIENLEMAVRYVQEYVEKED